MPSALQKRPWANGRSLDTQTTAVLSKDAARSLNSRTDWAHTPVSNEGKTLRTTRLPEKSWDVTGLRSEPTRSKVGAVVPESGSSPEMRTVFP